MQRARSFGGAQDYWLTTGKEKKKKRECGRENKGEVMAGADLLSIITVWGQTLQHYETGGPTGRRLTPEKS